MMNQIQELTPKNLNFLRKTTRKHCPVLIEPPVDTKYLITNVSSKDDNVTVPYCNDW